MKLKISKIERKDNKLEIYIKRPRLTSLYNVFKYLENIYSDNHESYLGSCIDITGKYLVATFILRNMKDIEPYKLDYEEAEKQILSKYDYAILVERYKTTFINKGREEQGVRKLEFEAEPGCIPRINIFK